MTPRYDDGYNSDRKVDESLRDVARIKLTPEEHRMTDQTPRVRMIIFDRFCKAKGLPRPHGLAGWSPLFVDPDKVVIVKARRMS